MNDIILKYLNKNYRFNLSTYTSCGFKIYDIINNHEVSLTILINDIILLFDIDLEESGRMFDLWVDAQIIKLKNSITDLRYKYYEKYGVELDLTPPETNEALESGVYHGISIPW